MNILGPNLTGLRGTQVTDSINYTLVKDIHVASYRPLFGTSPGSTVDMTLILVD
jgi:hypothetical protein